MEEYWISAKGADFDLILFLSVGDLNTNNSVMH